MTETEHTTPAAMDVCETDDREAAIPEFLEWLEQHGVEHPKIGFLRQGAHNLSLLATEDIHVCFQELSHLSNIHFCLLFFFNNPCSTFRVEMML